MLRLSSLDEIEKQKILFSNCTTEIRSYLFCKKGDEVVGWSWGFQIVSSKHHASNNAIIIPKLKAGFKIMGMKIHPRFGTLIELHYYTNPKVASVVDYRTGEKKSLPN